jgi:flagellar hook-associated protein 1
MKGLGGDASSLQDQRDLVVQEIGERIGARTVEDASGRLTLFSAGAVLVEGDRALAINVDLDAGGKLRFTAQGATSLDLTSRIDSGTLGGIREARDVDLVKTKQGLDAYAFDVAATFNAMHSGGYGLDGATGRALFTTTASANGAAAAMTISEAIDGHPERIAAALTAGQVPGGNANAVRLAELGEKDAFGGASLANRYAAIASDVGTRRVAAENEEVLRTDTLAVAEALAQDASGVSLDEEMVDLSRYQRAFEANTKMLRAVDELLETLMNAF